MRLGTTIGISISIATRDYEAEQSSLRKAVNRWMASHPYWLTNPFPQGQASRGVQGRAYKDFKAYVRAEATDEHGNMEYPTETEVFKKRLGQATIQVRKPFGIVRPTTSSVTGQKRAKGAPSCKTWAVKKEGLLQNPIMALRHRETQYRISQTDHHRLIQQFHWEARSEATRAIKKEIDFATTIQSLGGVSSRVIAQQVMNTPNLHLKNLSVVEYATNVGGVYIFYTELDNVEGIEHESTRFITQGQTSYGRNKGNHNSILMWNPDGVEFPNNICPYKERFDQGFQVISKVDCIVLGLEYTTLVDAVMTRTEGLKIEKACHYALNDLVIGRQRLHRVPGASFKVPEHGQTQRRIIGATFLPPRFFEDNPDIVIVGSHDARHGNLDSASERSSLSVPIVVEPNVFELPMVAYAGPMVTDESPKKPAARSKKTTEGSTMVRPKKVAKLVQSDLPFFWMSKQKASKSDDGG